MKEIFILLCVVVGIGLVLLSLPFAVYLTAKMAAFGFLRGKQLFEQFKEKKDGDEESKKT